MARVYHARLSALRRGREFRFERGLRPRGPLLGKVRKGVKPSSELHPHDLDVDAPRARAVQLGEQNGLEAAEGELAAADTHGHAPPQEGGAEMRVRIAALAI